MSKIQYIRKILGGKICSLEIKCKYILNKKIIIIMKNKHSVSYEMTPSKIRIWMLLEIWKLITYLVLISAFKIP